VGDTKCIQKLLRKRMREKASFDAVPTPGLLQARYLPPPSKGLILAAEDTMHREKCALSLVHHTSWGGHPESHVCQQVPVHKLQGCDSRAGLGGHHVGDAQAGRTLCLLSLLCALLSTSALTLKLPILLLLSPVLFFCQHWGVNSEPHEW
jgi:hypothetical protein